MLTLQIKKKWFDMIATGEKKEEYREIKPYYRSRFAIFHDTVRFKNGYRKDSPEMICKFTLAQGQGKPEWGAEPGKSYYILEITEVLK